MDQRACQHHALVHAAGELPWVGIFKAMQAHHEEYPYETVESRIVQTADAISGARPGARRDNVENYLKRLGDLEATATSFPGIEKAYALQAGRDALSQAQAEWDKFAEKNAVEPLPTVLESYRERLRADEEKADAQKRAVLALEELESNVNLLVQLTAS